ncbi:hypothetical protein F4821DRAFT_250126 [Hypoxylon rubiginosum]|uniref:Uncharacterized protein n=1 Tax=Hypoxylon rubiginosum TaxID=110542 RepID=A0ACC0CKX7_9PEZI|nr:hypothetical protein F4821DRAFT_250126 [Hypoxylon rubiginosum]
MSHPGNNNNESPTVSFDEDDKRPCVDRYVKRPQFRVGDKVFVINTSGSREGPYFVASVSGGKFKLSGEDGQSAKNGDEFSLDSLEEA